MMMVILLHRIGIHVFEIIESRAAFFLHCTRDVEFFFFFLFPAFIESHMKNSESLPMISLEVVIMLPM